MNTTTATEYMDFNFNIFASVEAALAAICPEGTARPATAADYADPDLFTTDGTVFIYDTFGRRVTGIAPITAEDAEHYRRQTTGRLHNAIEDC